MPSNYIDRPAESPPATAKTQFKTPAKAPPGGWPLVTPSFERRHAAAKFNGADDLPVLIDRGACGSEQPLKSSDWDNEALQVLWSLFKTNLPDMARNLHSSIDISNVPGELADRALQGKLLWALVQHLQLLSRGLDAYLPVGDTSAIFDAVEAGDPLATLAGESAVPEPSPGVQAALSPQATSSSNPEDIEAEKRRIKNLKRNLRRRGPTARKNKSNLLVMFEALHKADPETSHRLLADLLGPSFTCILKDHGKTLSSRAESAPDSPNKQATADARPDFWICQEVDPHFPQVIAQAVSHAAAPKGHDFIGQLLRQPTRLCAFAIEVLSTLETQVADLAIRWACIEYPAYSCGRFFSIDHGRLHACSVESERYEQSEFRIVHVDSWWALELLLEKLADLEPIDDGAPVVAISCEGIDLNRKGNLCLMQFSFHNDSSTVYILDVWKLGLKSFTYTHEETSIKSMLEDESLPKIAYDPRRVIDALHHQGNVTLTNVLDLQVLEVAARRSSGSRVSYIADLKKSIDKYIKFGEEQAEAYHKLHREALDLFDKSEGGDPTLLMERPIHPKLLMHVAYAARYLFSLNTILNDAVHHEKYMESVVQESNRRAICYESKKFIEPTTAAPDF